MKKSSLGRRSTNVFGRKTSEFLERKSNIPVASSGLSRSSSANNLRIPPSSIPRKRDLSADRVSEIPFTPGTMGTLRTPRSMTMSSGRPSSMSGKKGETRPLTDKDWQASAVITVKDALWEDPDSQHLVEENRSLKPMSIALFINICNSLLRRIDSTLLVDKATYITELPYILKKMQYKGRADKGTLQTVNTLHAWPAVLGIIHFLAELCLAASSFKREALNAMYPQVVEQHMEEDGLNLKFFVPVFKQMWESLKESSDVQLEALVKSHEHQVNQAIADSGYTEDIIHQYNNMEKMYGMEVERNEEAKEEFRRAEEELERASDQLKTADDKNRDLRKELEDMKRKLEQEMRENDEMERELKHIEDKTAATNDLLSRYEDQNLMEPGEYEEYKAAKKRLKEEIADAKKSHMILQHLKMDEIINNKTLKTECENLMDEYNSKIVKVMEEDVSVIKALCHSKPSNQSEMPSTDLLQSVLDSYRERICGLDQSQVAALSQRRAHLDFLVTSKHQQNEDLKRKLMKEEKERMAVAAEIEKTKADLEKNLAEYAELEEMVKTKRVNLEKLEHICKRKLQLRTQSIINLDKKIQALLDKQDGKIKKIISRVAKKK